MGQVRATIVEIGKSAWAEAKHESAPLGARVIVRRYAGEFVTGIDGVPYRLVNDKDIFATFDDDFPQQAN